MDISELPFFVGILLILVAFFAVFVAGSHKAKRLPTLLRWPVRAGASAGAALTVILIALFVLVDYWWTGRAPAAYSPDGKHVAVLTWRSLSAIDDGIATIKVRHSYSPFAKKVYSGPGYSADSVAQLRWIDNSHLLIRYGGWLGYDQACAPHAFGVEVTCEQIEPSAPDAIQMVGPRAVCDAAVDELREEHTGKVGVVVTVSPSGAVETFETVFPKGLQLVKEAADAVKKIRFQPAIGGPLVRVNTVMFDCSRP
jgi:hypothetical protein